MPSLNCKGAVTPMTTGSRHTRNSWTVLVDRHEPLTHLNPVGYERVAWNWAACRQKANGRLVSLHESASLHIAEPLTKNEIGAPVPFRRFLKGISAWPHSYL